MMQPSGAKLGTHTSTGGRTPLGPRLPCHANLPLDELGPNISQAAHWLSLYFEE